MVQDAKHVMAEPGWKLPHNEIWNIPTDTNEVRGEIATRGPWQLITGYRALAVDCDHRIFGMRSLSHARQEGYQLEGHVSIGGKSYRGFTSSTLFERPDGTLCNVATIYVCHDEPFESPNLDGLPDDELAAFISKYWYANGTRGKLKDYAFQTQMARQFRLEGNVEIALHAEESADSIYKGLPDWAKWWPADCWSVSPHV